MATLVRSALVVLALLGSAAGRGGAAGGGGPVEQAAERFQELDFEGALQELDRALGTPGNRPEDLVRIYSLRARCLLSLGHEAEAREAFTAALSIDPTFRLGPDASPRFAEPLARLLERGVEALAVEVVVPAEVRVGDAVPVTVLLTADPAGICDSFRFRYRRGQGRYAAVKVRLIRYRKSHFYLPPGVWKVPGQYDLEWHGEVLDRHGGVLARQGDARRPLVIGVLAGADLAASVVPPPPEGQIVAAPAAGEAPPPAWYQRWWVWAIVGGAVVAAGTVAGVMAAAGDPPQHRTFSVEVR